MMRVGFLISILILVRWCNKIFSINTGCTNTDVYVLLDVGLLSDDKSYIISRYDVRILWKNAGG